MQQPSGGGFDIDWTEFGQMDIDPRIPEEVEVQGIMGGSEIIVTRQERSATAVYKIAQALTDLLQYHSNGKNPEAPAQRTQLFLRAIKAIRHGLDRGHINVQEDKIWAAAHKPHINELVQRLAKSCLLQSSEEGPAITAVSQTPPFYTTAEINPYWSSRKDRLNTKKSQLNIAPCGNSWELQVAQTLDNHPSVLAWARNDRQRWQLPYLHQGEWQYYEPDFVARVSQGENQPVNVVIEVKGREWNGDLDKSRYTTQFWVPAVNSDQSLSQHGQWVYWYVDHPSKAHMMIDQLAGIASHQII